MFVLFLHSALPGWLSYGFLWVSCLLHNNNNNTDNNSTHNNTNNTTNTKNTTTTTNNNNNNNNMEVARSAAHRLPRWPQLSLPACQGASTVGFHNFNLRIFNLRVSNPNKLIVDVFLTRCRISMCQGLGPKKHDEILEIDSMKHKANQLNAQNIL